jgi:riboflavin biosynthesis pyrimidine reductase
VLQRPYVLLSCGMSIDGYLDDAADERLLLSNDADFDRVDEVRAGCDAILVGAGTVRADDPRLLVRSPARRAAREARGLPPTPARVVLSSAALDPGAAVCTGGPPPLVLGGALPDVLAELADRGVARLLVEGGASVLTAVIAAGLADELRLAVAPVFVGDPRAPRLLGAEGLGRARLLGVGAVGDTAVLRYGF